MPIIKVKKTKEYIYGIWEITETINELLKKLNPSKLEISQFKKISHLERKKQSVAAKLILNKLAKKKIVISYKNKIPYCNEYENISITHSDIYSAVLISKKNIGIDLQKEKRKIEKIKTKFIHEDQKDFHFSIEELHYIWTSKEAIYKTLKGAQCSFKKNIFLNQNKKDGYYKLGEKKIKFKLEIKKDNALYLAIAKQK